MEFAFHTIWKSSNTTQSTVQTQENDAQICAHAAEYDEIVQMRTGHFDISVLNEK